MAKKSSKRRKEAKRRKERKLKSLDRTIKPRNVALEEHLKRGGAGAGFHSKRKYSRKVKHKARHNPSNATIRAMKTAILKAPMADLVIRRLYPDQDLESQAATLARGFLVQAEAARDEGRTRDEAEDFLRDYVDEIIEEIGEDPDTYDKRVMRNLEMMTVEPALALIYGSTQTVPDVQAPPISRTRLSSFVDEDDDETLALVEAQAAAFESGEGVDEDEGLDDLDEIETAPTSLLSVGGGLKSLAERMGLGRKDEDIQGPPETPGRRARSRREDLAVPDDVGARHRRLEGFKEFVVTRRTGDVPPDEILRDVARERGILLYALQNGSTQVWIKPRPQGGKWVGLTEVFKGKQGVPSYKKAEMYVRQWRGFDQSGKPDWSRAKKSRLKAPVFAAMQGVDEMGLIAPGLDVDQIRRRDYGSPPDSFAQMMKVLGGD